MVNTLEVNLKGLEFDRFVVAQNQSQNAIFASGRVKERVENFLIDPDGEWVKLQVNRHFEELPYELGKIIAKKAENLYGKIRVYRVPSLNFIS